MIILVFLDFRIIRLFRMFRPRVHVFEVSLKIICCPLVDLASVSSAGFHGTSSRWIYSLRRMMWLCCSMFWIEFRIELLLRGGDLWILPFFCLGGSLTIPFLGGGSEDRWMIRVRRFVHAAEWWWVESWRWWGECLFPLALERSIL